VIRLSNEEDLREDLELGVLELQDRFGVASSSIRRYVNSAIRATTDRDGIRATVFLRKRWTREQVSSETPSRPIGNARNSPQTATAATGG
jgi:hypothetical protein